MTPEPRLGADYSERQVEAARRVLVDLGQVLASVSDCLVIVGGWAPDLLLKDSEESHVGSIDVDMVLDVAKLSDGRYAELIQLLLDTRRYEKGVKDFQFVTHVEMQDGERPVQVEVDFLAPKNVTLDKHDPKLIEDFRVLQVEGSEVAFRAPIAVTLTGINIRGAHNTVSLRVVSLPDFVLMKAFAIGGRDKPKDSYDICYCLQHCPGGMKAVAEDWKGRISEPAVVKAVGILNDKFATVQSLGPQQLVEFNDSDQKDAQERDARRAFELVREFLRMLN